MLENKESKKLEQLNRWSKSKGRKIFLYTLLIFLGLIFVYLIIMFLLGGITLKELCWILFFLLVILIWCKAVFDLEKHVKFLLKIIEKLR